MAASLKVHIQEILNKVNTYISNQALPSNPPPHYFILEEIKYEHKSMSEFAFKLQIIDNVTNSIYLKEIWIKQPGSNEDDEVIWGVLYTRLLLNIFLCSFSHIKSMNDKYFKIFHNA